MAYTLKDARDWFKSHPDCKVIYHRRWDKLSPASQERLSLSRTVSLRGTRAVFSDGSELPLRTETNTSRSSGNLLDILDGNGLIIVTYEGVA